MNNFPPPYAQPTYPTLQILDLKSKQTCVQSKALGCFILILILMLRVLMANLLISGHVCISLRLFFIVDFGCCELVMFFGQLSAIQSLDAFREGSFDSWILFFTHLFIAIKLAIIRDYTMLQAAERARSQEGGVFQKRPADFMQMFKVRMHACTNINHMQFPSHLWTSIFCQQ